MNFQDVHPVPSAKFLLDRAFQKARQKSVSKNLTGNWLQIIRQKEAMKLDIVKDNLVVALIDIPRTFPSLDDLPSFYYKLMNLTLDLQKLKKSLAAINWAAKRIRAFQKKYVRMIVKEKERSKIKQLSAQFYGRASSVMKQITTNLEYLEESRKIMKTYPDIKELFTVCIYGFPNVGKSTLLNKLAGTKAKVAAYSFTTTTINSGQIQLHNKEIQILDVPGTLAREEKMNNIERQADLVAKELADVIIFVFDLSGHSGYSYKMQQQLLRQLGKKTKILVYLSKLDLTPEEILEEAKLKHLSLDEIKKKIGLMAQKNNLLAQVVSKL
jgi:nucleolar GTP-binding protein